MSIGLFIAVVGPSGVGKDSLMEAVRARRPEIGTVRRVVTRAPGLGGEEIEAVNGEEFRRRDMAGEFCLSWEAHGLSYGIPVDTLARVKRGEMVLVNLSRNVLTEAQQIFDNFLVLSVTARTDILAQRLAARGRESRDEIEKRLSRRIAPFSDELRVITIENNGTIDAAGDSVIRALETLSTYPESA